MICSIMQPTYLPWAGYFNLIAKSDIFVFLDDAQFEKNSWCNRNRILVNSKPHWITVPIRRANLNQTINESYIDTTKNWKKKHIKLLNHTYGKHPFSKEINEFCDILDKDTSLNLGALNINLIKWFLSKLEIKTEIYLASELGVLGKRTNRIIKILNLLNVSSYLSPIGAKEYLMEDHFYDNTKINLDFQSFDTYQYPQFGHSSFLSHLSIVDLLANIGWKATKIYVE